MSDTRTTEELRQAISRTTNDVLNYIDGGPLFREACAMFADIDTLTSRLEALEAEHEAVGRHEATLTLLPNGAWQDIATAHDNAERVMGR